MSKIIDLEGKRFGKLIVLGRAENDKSDKAVWKCQCDCGNIIYCIGVKLRNGHTKSCGCLRRERFAETSFVHGKRDCRLYAVWNNMKQRCYNPDNKRYKSYGGRGITVCAEWTDKENGFINFYKWSYSNGYKENAKRGECTLDRINVNGNYEPSNCRWVTNVEQQRNKRNNKYIEYKGEVHTISEWSKILGISQQKLYRRIYTHKWEIERAFKTP